MLRLGRLIQKEFAQVRRDKRMFAIMLIAPIIQLIIIGYAATTDVNNLELGICDLDHSLESRDLIRSYTSSGYFELITTAETPDGLDKSLDKGEIAVALIIPPDFGKNLNSNTANRIQLLIDGADSTSGTIGMAYAKIVIQQFARPYLEDIQQKLSVRNISMPSVDASVRAWFNPELKSKVYMVPAGVGIVLLLLMIMLTSMALVKEREIGTLEQLIVTPIRGWELLLGKIIPFIIIGFVAETIVFLVAIFVFEVPLRGNIGTLYLLSFGFFFTTLGLGILVSTVSKTQQQAMLLTAFFIMMPFIYLSGFIFPIENMPYPIQLVTYVIPLRYFLVIARGVFLKGSGWLELWDEFAIMIFLGVIIFALATLRFQKKLD